MTTMKKVPGAVSHRVSGLVAGVRADKSNPVALIEEISKTFEAFKAENDARLQGIDKKFDDVVQAEKVDRINADLTTLTKAIDDMNASMAAMRLSGDAKQADPAKAEHAKAFNQWFRKGSTDAENRLPELQVKASLTSQSDPDGGFLVPEENEAAIDRVLGTVSAVRSLARVQTISGQVYKKLVNMGGAGSGWVGEEESRPETDSPTLREIAINAMEMYANPATTQTLLDDARVDISQWLADEVSVEFAEQEGAAFVSGSGVNRPRGFLSYDTVANASYAWGKVGFVVTGKADGFLDLDVAAGEYPADSIIDLYYALRAGYRNGASWITSDAVMGTIRKFKDGDGNYLWAPPTGPDMPATILGKPVVSDDNMPALGANTFPLAFGNWQRGYMVVDRVGIRVLRDPYTNKPFVHFYTTKRVGGGVINFEAIKLLKCST